MTISATVSIIKISVLISLMSGDLMTLTRDIQPSKAESFHEVCAE